jgi:hypothetical protein
MGCFERKGIMNRRMTSSAAKFFTGFGFAAAILVSATVAAHADDRWHEHEWHEHEWHDRGWHDHHPGYVAPPVVLAPPARVIYAPPPVVVSPPPLIPGINVILPVHIH